MLAPALESVCNEWRYRHASIEAIADALLADVRLLHLGVQTVPVAVTRQFAADVLSGGIRGYDQGIDAALSWLTLVRLNAIASAVRDRPFTARPGDRVVVEVVKEGHMSSVVAVGLMRPGGRDVRFVVNVARDATTASAEQSKLARRLADIAGNGAVRMLESGSSTIQWFGRRLELDLLAVSFAAGQEVHPLPAAYGGGPARLLLVDRFHDDPGSYVPGIRGRLLTTDEADAIWSFVISTTTQHARFSQGRVVAMEVELADGDVVADVSGRHPATTLVAANPDEWHSPAAWWPYHVALASARDDHGGESRVRWGQPERAFAAMIERLGTDGAELLDRASRLSDAELTRVATVHELDTLDDVTNIRTLCASRSRPPGDCPHFARS